MGFSIQKYVSDLLRNNPETRYTARQIAEWIVTKFPEEVEAKRQKSQAKVVPLDTNEAMLTQIVAEIGAQRKNLEKKYPDIRTTEGRPRKYFSTSNVDDVDGEAVENKIHPDLESNTTPFQNEYFEVDLYPKLSEFLREDRGIFLKRIDEKRSRNNKGKGGNKWLFPDLVGMEVLSSAWTHEILEVVKQYSDKRTRLWSFEVKRELNGANIRESYFQAVSNSSWANFGYSVAAEIQGRDTIKELQVLSNMHGIGVIILNLDNISESQFLIPGKEKKDIDWDAANRLADQNLDFVNYINLVREFYQTSNPKPKEWD